MADRVRFIMENMALSFRQLVELKLFTDEEIKVTIKKRTDFEYLLRRRQLQPSDFQRYLEFEINLERLRTIREEASARSRSKDQIALYRAVKAASIRHISYIFDRAIRRFPSNMSFWADYIAFLQLKKSNAMLNTLYGKALSLHPSNVNFWLQASIHELETNGNSHSARVLLQRGLRTNKKSSELWLRYFDLELWNALRLIERKKILEIGEEEEEADLIEAAPLVVFKHAIQSLRQDADTHTHAHDIHPAILQMHLASEGFVNRLSLAMEKLLKKNFSRTIGFWQHIVHIHLRRALSQAQVLGKETTLGKRAQTTTPVEVLDAVAMAMNKCVTLLREANDVFLSSDLWVQWVQAALNLLLDTMCECMSAITGVSTYTENPTSHSSDGVVEDHRPVKKSRKSTETTNRNPVKAGQEQGQEIESFRSKYASSLDAIQSLMSELVQSHSAHVQSGAIHRVQPAGADEPALTTPLAVVIEFHFFLLTLMFSSDRFSIPDLSNNNNDNIRNSHYWAEKEASLLSGRIVSLVDWVQRSAEKYFSARAAPVGIARDNHLSDAVGLEKSFVVDWCKAVKVCLSAFQRHEMIAVKSSDALLQQFLAALGPVSLTLVASKEGCSLLLDAVDVAGSSASGCEAGRALLRRIINGKPCTQSMLVISASRSDNNYSSDHRVGNDTNRDDRILTKGEWCKVYLRYQSSCAWSTDAADTDTDPFLEGYNYVLQRVRAKPHYFTASDLEEFFRFVTAFLKTQLTVSNGSDSSSNSNSNSIVSRIVEKKMKNAVPANDSGTLESSRAISAFALRVAEEAVKVCPAVASFWTYLIELHESNGDYTAAEAVRWRSNRA